MKKLTMVGAAGALILLYATYAVGEGSGRLAARAEYAALPKPTPHIITHTVTRTVTVRVPVTKIVTRTVIKTVRVAAPTAVPTAVPTAEPTSVPQNTVAPSDNSEVTYNDVSVARTQLENDSDGDFPPEAGKKFITVHITINNNSDQNYDYNALYFELEGSDNTRYTSGALDSNITDHTLSAGTLAPGQSVAGDLAFAVPSDENSFGLLWTPDALALAPAQYVPLS